MAADPKQILIINQQRTNRLITGTSLEHTRKLLKRAQRDLERRLRDAEDLGQGADETFTSAKMRSTLRQVQHVLRALKTGMKDQIVDTGKHVAETQTETLLRYMNAGEKYYRGVSQPLRIDEARLLDRVASGTESSILRRIATDPLNPGQPGVLDRYGDNVIDRIEEQLQMRYVAGRSWGETRDAIVDQSTFLQDAPASWADRIAVTEIASANNRANWEGIRNVNQILGGDVVKIIYSVDDNRTGSDSLAVHGEIRRVDEAFETWYGLVQTPPDRPRDRATIVSHRLSWGPPPANLKWKSMGEIAARWALEGRKTAMPARPLMTTVPLDSFVAK